MSHVRPLSSSRKARRGGRRRLGLLLVVAPIAVLAILGTIGYVSADHVHDATGAPVAPPYGHVLIGPYTCFGPGIGYGYGPAPAFTLMRPTFHDVSQRIRYIPDSQVEYNAGHDRFGYTNGSNCDRFYGHQIVPGDALAPTVAPRPNGGSYAPSTSQLDEWGADATYSGP